MDQAAEALEHDITVENACLDLLPRDNADVLRVDEENQWCIGYDRLTGEEFGYIALPPGPIEPWHTLTWTLALTLGPILLIIAFVALTKNNTTSWAWTREEANGD